MVWFPKVIYFLMYGHVRATRNISQNYDSVLGALPLARYHNS